MEKSELQLGLEELLDSYDLEFEIRSYSGRGMCGKECLAITCDTVDLFTIGFELGKTESYSDGLHQPPQPKMDSMGLGVVLYWPRIQYVTDDETVG